MKRKNLCKLEPGTRVTHKKSGLEFEFVEVARLAGSWPETVEVAFCKVLPGRDYTFMPREITKKSISDFDRVDVLVDNYCTREEAERYLKNGAAIFTPHDFWEEIREDEEYKNALEVHNIDTIMGRCKYSSYIHDIGYGMLEGVPYVIQYVL